LKKGSKEAKAWGRKMKRKREAKNNKKRKTKRKTTTRKRRTTRKGDLTLKRKKAYRSRRKNSDSAWNF
jgi:hypothetical protein